MSCLFARLGQDIGEKVGRRKEEGNTNRGHGKEKKGKRGRNNFSTTAGIFRN